MPVRDNNTIVAHIVDDRAETVGRTVVSALAAAQVTSTEVHNSEQVSRGQVLFRMDNRPYRLAVTVAQAELAVAPHRIAAFRTVYRQHLAALAAVQDVLAYQQQAHDRQTQLFVERRDFPARI